MVGWKKKDDDDNDNTKSIAPTSCVDYAGKYYQLEKISVGPKPYQKPHPPIFIGTLGIIRSRHKKGRKIW